MPPKDSPTFHSTPSLLLLATSHDTPSSSQSVDGGLSKQSSISNRSRRRLADDDDVTLVHTAAPSSPPKNRRVGLTRQSSSSSISSTSSVRSISTTSSSRSISSTRSLPTTLHQRKCRHYQARHFEPQLYQDMIHRWVNRPFLRKEIHCFLNVPLGLQGQVHEARRKISKTEDANDGQNWVLMESNPYTSSWTKTQILFSIASDEYFESEELVWLNGTYVSRVFKRPRNSTDWTSEMTEWVQGTLRKQIRPEDKNTYFTYSPNQRTKEGVSDLTVLFVKMA
mmetsp:Transcript_21197/g.48920  ORF Transcript_21197/g.48920 Transcript_21197/m.48920 type:complete len:281 (+) Transcript_21197:422-1264(+)